MPGSSNTPSSNTTQSPMTCSSASSSSMGRREDWKEEVGEKEWGFLGRFSVVLGDDKGL